MASNVVDMYGEVFASHGASHTCYGGGTSVVWLSETALSLLVAAAMLSIVGAGAGGLLGWGHEDVSYLGCEVA